MTERLRVDVSAAVRALTSRPATAVTVLVTLAVAAGMNLAMFSLVDRAILSPPAHVSEPGQVFTLVFEPLGDESGRIRMTTISYPAFEALRDIVSAAAETAAWQRVSASAVVDGSQMRVDAMLVTGRYFTALGARPHLGRALLPEDDRRAGERSAVVLSHEFWTRVLGADPGVLGRRISLRGIDYAVAGVMPAGFTGHSAARVDAWLPFSAAMQHTPGWDTNPRRNLAAVVMRLTPTESVATAAAQAQHAVDRRVTLQPVLGAEVSQADRRIAFWLTGISVVVLVIGLANAATLLLVRGAGRRRELAIRTAMGASRARLFTQLLIEGALLAIAATSAALALAYWFDEAVRGVLLPSLAENAGLRARVLGAAAIAGLLALIAATAASSVHLPAYFAPRDLSGASSGRPRTRLFTALLVVQTTLSVALLAGAGVFGRSFYKLAAQDFGMRLNRVLLVELEQGPGAIPGRDDLFYGALERIRSLPGIDRATVVQNLPFNGFRVIPVGIPGFADSPNVNGQLPHLIPATPDLFDILDLQLVEGRRFTEADDKGAPVVIVNSTMARTIWPNTSALGKCIRIGFDPSFDPFNAVGPPGPPTTTPCREIIGVVRDVRQRSVIPTGIENRLMQYFVPFSQVPVSPGENPAGERIWGLLVRTSASPNALAGPIRSLVVGSRTDLPFVQVRPYADLLARQMRPWRLGTVLLAIFGGLALGVAAVGLYAAFAHLVGQRRREMAIRIAIGARPAGVLAMILREAAAMAIAGVVCGALLVVATGRWVESMLFETKPSDPVVLASAALLMIVVAAAATFLPARSASRTDPNTLLRAE